MNRHTGFLILAVVLFLVGAVFAFIDGEPKWAEAVCLFGGLTSFTAAHLP